MHEERLQERLDTALRTGRFAEILQLAILRSTWTLERISARLNGRGHPISPTTLSNWQRGDTAPVRAVSLAALADLEELLRLPRGALRMAALSGRRRTAPAVGSERLVTVPSAIDRLRQRVGPEHFGGYRIQHVHETHIIGPDGLPTRHETRQVLTAIRDGLDAYYHVFLTGDGTGSIDDKVRVEAMSGCVAGRVVRESPDVVCVPLHFGISLHPGESHLFEYATELGYPRNPPPPELRRGVRTPLEQLVLRVVFHPERRPARVEACHWPDPRGEPEVVAELRLDSALTVDHLVNQPRPGVYGIRWTWPR